MKKRKIKNESNENLPPADDHQLKEEFPAELSDSDSIQEFIKIKKLQNQILEKMLEKISHPNQKEKTNQKNK